MKKVLFLICTLCVLSGCSSVSKLNVGSEPIMPISSLTTDFVRKDFAVKGRVRGEYSKSCFLFNLICTNEIFIFDDLMQKAVKLDANEVIDVVVDKQASSWLWVVLYSHQSYRANGLAIKLTEVDKRASAQ